MTYPLRTQRDINVAAFANIDDQTDDPMPDVLRKAQQLLRTGHISLADAVLGHAIARLAG